MTGVQTCALPIWQWAISGKTHGGYLLREAVAAALGDADPLTVSALFLHSPTPARPPSRSRRFARAVGSVTIGYVRPCTKLNLYERTPATALAARSKILSSLDYGPVSTPSPNAATQRCR